MRLSDARYSFIFGTGDWRALSRCREVEVEMVPGEDGNDQPSGPEVQLAKQTCASCPVQEQCMEAAGAQTGVWAGLTKNERDRLKLSALTTGKLADKRSIVKCEVCGYRCVPMLKTDLRCDDCLPESARPQSAEGVKAQIVALIDEGRAYAEIGLLVGLPEKTVGEACREWGHRSKAAGMKRGGSHDPNRLAPCGTPAAKRRHQRKGEPITTCACAKPGSSNPERLMKKGWVA